VVAGKTTTMANKTLFASLMGALLPKTDAVNAEGAAAYARSPEQALAQFAATGCLNATFYARAEAQLDTVLGLARDVPTEFLARTAVYARERGRMKDMPAVLLAALSQLDVARMDRVFDRVIDSPRMLRTFVQIMRSGATGRKSLGTAPKRCVRRWLDARSDAELFAASVGEAPSLADVIRMVHPKPATASRAALYGYLLGRSIDRAALPANVLAFETFKADRGAGVPDVPFQMLTALDLDARAWREIARRGSWQMTRMNLNTFARHGVFEDREVTRVVADRLADARAVAAARALPYQLLATFRALAPAVPGVVRRAVEDAMELALANVPGLAGQVYVCPDVSGSMRSPITGDRGSATTAVRCVDVAALVAAALLRRDPTVEVLPFEQDVVDVRLSARDSVMTNADRLAAVGGGGTSVSAPLARLNGLGARGSLVIVVSDNESWVDAGRDNGTATLAEWAQFTGRNPGARLVLIDLQPSRTTQALDREDVLNVGGFSDAVFELIADFAAGRMTGNHWVDRIAAVAV
jgi:60 kDa SS-A/Ro ribonucleoprotein